MERRERREEVERGERRGRYRLSAGDCITNLREAGGAACLVVVAGRAAEALRMGRSRGGGVRTMKSGQSRLTNPE
jgi:hypothetical protein